MLNKEKVRVTSKGIKRTSNLKVYTLYTAIGLNRVLADRVRYSFSRLVYILPVIRNDTKRGFLGFTNKPIFATNERGYN